MKLVKDALCRASSLTLPSNACIIRTRTRLTSARTLGENVKLVLKVNYALLFMYSKNRGTYRPVTCSSFLID